MGQRAVRAGVPAVVALVLVSCADADHQRIGTDLDELAEWYHDQGRYADAVPLYERAVAIRERAFGPDHPKTAAALDDLAKLYHDQGRYAEAEPLFRRARASRELALGPGHPKTAATLDDLGQLLGDQGNYAEAEPLLQRALMVRERSFGPAHPKTAATLDNLAALYRHQGRYAEAEPLFLRALAIRERAFGADHPKTASTLDNLAQLYRNQGRYDEARGLFQRALAVRERVFGAEHPTTAATLDNLAALLQDQGRYIEAEPLFQRALAIRDGALGADHPKTIATLDNLAELYLDYGRFADAEPLFLRALAAREAILGPDHPKTAATLDDLAELYHIQGRYGEAERLFEQALAIRERAFGADHAAPAGTRDNLAGLYHEQGRSAEAERLYEDALAVLERRLGPEHSKTAATLDNLATLYRDLDRYGEAEPLFERALAIREEAFGAEHPKTASTLDNLAALYYGQERFEAALDAIRRATAIYRARAAHGAGRISGESFRERPRVRATFGKHVRIAAALAARDPARRADLAAEAFEVAQLAKATDTAAALTRMAARFAAGDDALAAALRARQDALERWRWADGALLEAASRPTQERDHASESELRAQRDELDRRIRELEERLRRQFPEYAELESPTPAPLTAVQRLLGADEALVLYLVSKDDVVVWAVRPERATMRHVALGHERLAGAVRQLRDGIVRPVVNLRDLPRFDLDLAFALYDQLLTPVAALLEDARHLFIVADGPLESLPFHLLVTAEPAAPPEEVADYRDVPWLARAYATTTLPAVSSLRALRRFAGAARAPEPFLGVGDPLLEGHPGAKRSVTVAELITARGLADPQRLRAIAALPETADELRTMAETLKANPDSLVLQERASESALKAAALDRYHVLAFATHGLIAGQLDGLAEPALVLTPPDVATPQDDGLLTASEVARLRLDAGWVILSACNTAAPDGTPGAEGLSGLAKAFLYAGSRALLVSHWPVQSIATVTLTTGAIRALAEDAGIGRAEALRRAMMAMLADPAPGYFAHPLFWAPFVVVGEGGSEVAL